MSKINHTIQNESVSDSSSEGYLDEDITQNINDNTANVNYLFKILFFFKSIYHSAINFLFTSRQETSNAQTDQDSYKSLILDDNNFQAKTKTLTFESVAGEWVLIQKDHNNSYEEVSVEYKEVIVNYNGKTIKVYMEFDSAVEVDPVRYEVYARNILQEHYNNGPSDFVV